jgi:hypothetical protein
VHFKKHVFKKDVLQKACAVGSMHSKCMLIINVWKVQGKPSSVGSARKRMHLDFGEKRELTSIWIKIYESNILGFLGYYRTTDQIQT